MSDAPAVSTPTGPAQPAYPRHWEADVVASDGGVVHLRPILPSDADALVALHDRLSARTRYLRYFGPHPHLSPREIEHFTVVDHHARVAFIALLGDEIIAVGRYEGMSAAGAAGAGGPAEIAFVVRDDHQGRGLGSILLEHLTAAARERGVRRFEAEVLAENSQMVRVFRDAGYQVSRAFEEGVVHLEFDVDPTERSVEVRDAREQRSEARSVHNVLHPRSVAVIGASTNPEKIGHAVLANLLRANFTGPVYPVNPEARSVRGVRAYPSVTDIPDDVDLAVVAVPAPGTREVMDSCLAKGVRALVVLSSALADPGADGLGADGLGADGLGAQRRFADEARAHGMRVVGPKALGVANTDPQVRLNATLAPDLPGHGRVGFFSQSGALGITLLSAAAERGLGFSTFVSAGSRADLSGNDMLQYWQTDPATDVVLLYLESFGNPRKFARLVRRLARSKPVVLVKSGGWSAGQPVVIPTRSSSGARTTDEAGVSALFEQTGVIRVQNVTQMFDTAQLLAHQPLPAGGRVAVVGNSTALNLLVVEALHGEGLEVAGEPVDAGTTVSPADLAAAVTAAGRRDDVDALVVVFVPPLTMAGEAHARALRTAAADLDKPLVTTFLGAQGMIDGPAAEPDGVPRGRSVPSYPTPERAVAALGRVTRYAGWRTAPVGEYVRPADIDVQGARALVENARTGAPGTAPSVLTDTDQVALLRCYGIEVLPFRRAATAAETVEAARELGFPVAIKAVEERWRHRADGAGVRLMVVTHQGARQAFTDLARLSGRDEVYVQRMGPAGTSCVFEVTDDPWFGSLVSFGLSGMVSELLGDRAHRVLPLSTADAAELVRAPRAAPLLVGYRGDPPARLDALEDLALRLSRLAADLPEVRTLVLDPVLAGPEGVAVAGARIELGPPPTREEASPRRLG
jgi:acyl-CoA synthetase (NDP forming)/GNAT superfamily N-acetyltransferase